MTILLTIAVVVLAGFSVVLYRRIAWLEQWLNEREEAISEWSQSIDDDVDELSDVTSDIVAYINQSENPTKATEH